MLALVNKENHGTYHAMWRQQHGDDDALTLDARDLRAKNGLKQRSSTTAK
jgi:hypothetical protein